ncbi:MAG: CHAT domain-containing protein [Microcystis sp. M049S2]|jgi:CHAT domain-containing protein|uniref:CHAT domain-containing protein n=1 Tax=unclassified Microcystis TaxID=2643300 RepID=UPI002583152F|nr:CHAT domain-containing tetratricopeptide repeat protein [Microcystis sp. M049S2]MCA2659121.1 CHAT domain-containing protein [Microcystis sp. M049S2]
MNHQYLRSLLFRLFLLIGLLTYSNFGNLGMKTTSAQVSDHKNSTVQLVQSTTQKDLCQYKRNDIEKRICMLEIKAQLSQESGNYEQAIEYLQRGLLYARYYRYWENKNNRSSMQLKIDDLSESLGDIYYKMQNYSKAIQHYKEASSYLSKFSETDLRLINLYIKLSKSFYNAKKLQESDQEAFKALKIIEILINSSEYVYRTYNNQLIPRGASSLTDQYQELYSLLQKIKVGRNQPEKALEFSERGRSLGLISLLSVKDDPFKQFQEPKYDIEKLRVIAKEQKATLIEYSIIDNNTLFIYVIQPNGKFHSRSVNLNNLEQIKENLYNEAYNQTLRSSEFPVILVLTIGVIFIGILIIANKKSFIIPSLIIICVVAGGLPFLNAQISDSRDHQKQSTKIEIASQHSSNDSQFSFKNFTKETFIAVRGKPTRNLPSNLTQENCQDDDECLQILYQILIKPIEELLPNNPEKHIIFFPEKDLYRVPFAALKSTDGRYLIEKHTIRIFPSIQSLDILRKKVQERSETGNKILVVGNPAIPKIKLINSNIAEEYDNLPYAEQEAKAIGKLLGTKPLIGQQATEKNILNQISQAKIIHFATHAILDVQVNRPKVLSRLNRRKADGYPSYLIESEYKKGVNVIALTPSAKDDGLLDEAEIYNLKNLNAELVVLSACNTGIGDITTDGVIGLARPFIANGVPSVVVSLWSVYDDTTSTLMIEFYKHLGKTSDKAQALRQAILTMIKNKNNPVDWSGFLLVGEADISQIPIKSRENQSSESKELTIEQLKNAEYYSYDPASKVKLNNGEFFSKYENGAIGGNSIWLGETIKLGDLNGDGAKDAVVVINQNTGGSGTFMDLAIVINDHGKPVHVDSYGLGDRVSISDVKIKPNGRIEFTVTERWGQIRKETYQFVEKKNKPKTP